jgi:hypothetical protein
MTPQIHEINRNRKASGTRNWLCTNVHEIGVTSPNTVEPIKTLSISRNSKGNISSSSSCLERFRSPIEKKGQYKRFQSQDERFSEDICRNQMKESNRVNPSILIHFVSFFQEHNGDKDQQSVSNYIIKLMHDNSAAPG